MAKGKDIKSLKPSKTSRYKQNYVNPKSLSKLFESQRSKPVIYRSSYERRFMLWLERSKSVKRWGSECVCVPYKDNEGNTHKYWPDFIVEFTDGRLWMVEIKPYSQTVKPDPRNEWAVEEYKKNIRKWTAAIDYCKARGMEFHIVTEHTVERL